MYQPPATRAPTSSDIPAMIRPAPASNGQRVPVHRIVSGQMQALSERDRDRLPEDVPLARGETVRVADSKLRLGSEPQAVPRARRFVSAALRGRAPETAVRTAELVVTELA